MNRRATTREWMAAAFLVGLVILLVVRAVVGPGERIPIALRATARWSFLLFWLASAGGALTTLFGSRFQALAHHARDFGLAFASAHLVHLGVVGWLYFSSTDLPPRSSLVFFGIGAVWTYVLAILSIKRLSARLNPRVWRTVRTLGVEYIALAFLTDFAKNPFQVGFLDAANYLPFLALATAGPVLRLAALVKRLSQMRRLAA